MGVVNLVETLEFKQRDTESKFQLALKLQYNCNLPQALEKQALDVAVLCLCLFKQLLKSCSPLQHKKVSFLEVVVIPYHYY